MKDFDTILNEMVFNTSYIIEAKAEKSLVYAELYSKGGDNQDSIRHTAVAKELMEVVELIRENEGCWV